MHDLPHEYRVIAGATADGDVSLTATGLPTIDSAPPAEFGGPGDRWSPESLLTAAVADCFVLTFRAIARASTLTWESLDCQTVGVLERAGDGVRFTRFLLRATLVVPPETDTGRARRLLDKAKARCLVTNSLRAETTLDASVTNP